MKHGVGINWEFCEEWIVPKLLKEDWAIQIMTDFEDVLSPDPKKHKLIWKLAIFNLKTYPAKRGFTANHPTSIVEAFVQALIKLIESGGK